MKVGIVGAGMAGLAAARDLIAEGHEVVVYEKSRGLGGRAATRRKDGFVWDTGATVVPEWFGPTIHLLGLPDAVRIDRPTWLHDGENVRPGDKDREGGYAFSEGITTLAKALAQGLDVRRETRIETLADLQNEFDALILTPPLPQTEALLTTIGENRGLGASRYRSCFSVLFGFATPLPETPYASLLDPSGEAPAQWVSLESVKCPGRAPAVVVQMSAAFTQTHYDRDRAEVAALALDGLRRLIDLPEPIASDVMRWRYSQPLELLDFDAVNPPGTRVLVASDGLAGGKLHHAYQTGQRAARRILDLASPLQSSPS